MSRKTQRVVLKSQAREIISKVYDFMKKEARNNYAEKLTDARWRTSQAVGVSESTVTRILSERKAHTMAQAPVPATETATVTTIKIEPYEANESEGIDTVPYIKQETDMIFVETKGSTSTSAVVETDPIVSENEESMSDSLLVTTSASIFGSPMRKRKVLPRKINLSEFDIDVVRKTIQNYHSEYQQYPTLSRLNHALKDRIAFDGSITTLRRLLHKLGYKWKRTENNRKVLSCKPK